MRASQSDQKIHTLLWVEIQQNGVAVAFIQLSQSFGVRLSLDDSGAWQFLNDELPQTLSDHRVPINYQDH
jgi:hypothetical protein